VVHCPVGACSAGLAVQALRLVLVNESRHQKKRRVWLGPGRKTWKSRRARERALRYNCCMSRLRRLFVTGKIFFITCNLLRTRALFVEADFATLADAIIRVRRRRGFLLGGYVFMPDHWHALLFPGQDDTLPRLMNSVKVAWMQSINRRRGTRGELWQPRYYDHALRTVKEYHDTLTYMHLNPVRKGLVQKPEDWPWSSIHSYGGPGPVRLEVDHLDVPADPTTPL